MYKLVNYFKLAAKYITAFNQNQFYLFFKKYYPFKFDEIIDCFIEQRAFDLEGCFTNRRQSL